MTEGIGTTPPAGSRPTDALNIMDVVVILVVLVTPSLVLTPWSQIAIFTDFPEYYGAAKLFAMGRFRDVYDLQALGQLQHVIYPDLHGQAVLWLKPHILLPLMFFDAGAGSFGVLLRTCILGAIGSIIALLFGGPSVFDAYCRLIGSAEARFYMGSIAGPTLRGQLMRLKLPH